MDLVDFVVARILDQLKRPGFKCRPGIKISTLILGIGGGHQSVDDAVEFGGESRTIGLTK